jgi:hypothetical protein
MLALLLWPRRGSFSRARRARMMLPMAATAIRCSFSAHVVAAVAGMSRALRVGVRWQQAPKRGAPAFPARSSFPSLRCACAADVRSKFTHAFVRDRSANHHPAFSKRPAHIISPRKARVVKRAHSRRSRRARCHSPTARVFTRSCVDGKAGSASCIALAARTTAPVRRTRLTCTAAKPAGPAAHTRNSQPASPQRAPLGTDAAAAGLRTHAHAITRRRVTLRQARHSSHATCALASSAK